jgi:hypothetical protein
MNATIKEIQEEIMERLEVKKEANNKKFEILEDILVSLVDIHHDRTEAIQEEIKVKMSKYQEKMEAAIGSDKEELRAAINSIRAELEESTKHQVEDFLVSRGHRTQETQAEIEVTKILVDTTRRGIEDKIQREDRISDSRLE